MIKPCVQIRLLFAVLVENGISGVVLENESVADQVSRLRFGEPVVLADGSGGYEDAVLIYTLKRNLLAVLVHIIPLVVQHIALVQLVEVLGELAGQQVEGLLVVGDAPLGEGVLVDGLVGGGGELALLGEHFPLGLEGAVEVVVVQHHLPGVLLLHGDLEPLALHLHIGGGDFGSGDGVGDGALGRLGIVGLFIFHAGVGAGHVT